jgi:poly(ADP-ribose) glycohydrolase
MTGSERFSKYTGYSATFEWAGNYVDTTARDKHNRRLTKIVAVSF